MERQQLGEILRIIIGVSQNLYSIEIKSMMNPFVYAVFHSLTARRENHHQISKDRSLTLGSINIAEQVETLQIISKDRSLTLGSINIAEQVETLQIISKDRSLTLGSINIAEQVETLQINL